MEFFLEALFQFLGELLFQILFEVGLSGLIEPFKKRSHPVLTGIGFVLFGILAGGMSLIIFQKLLVNDPVLRIVNVLVTSVIAGLLMFFLGKIREKKTVQPVGIDRFVYGLMFGLAMALVRYLVLK